MNFPYHEDINSIELYNFLKEKLVGFEIENSEKLESRSSHYTRDFISRSFGYGTEGFSATFEKNKITEVKKITYIDITTIKKQCEIKNFPMIISESLSLNYNNNKIYLHNNITNTKTEIKIKDVYSYNKNNYAALYPYDKVIDDGYILMPGFSSENEYVFALTRFGWGLNIYVGILNLENSTLYHWMVNNYDHPEGRAIKKIDDDLEIYFGYDGIQNIETIYGPKEEFKCLDGWKKYNFKQYLIKLRSYIAENYDDSVNSIGSKLREEAFNLLESKEYEKALIAYEKYSSFDSLYNLNYMKRRFEYEIFLLNTNTEENIGKAGKMIAASIDKHGRKFYFNSWKTDPIFNLLMDNVDILKALNI